MGLIYRNRPGVTSIWFNLFQSRSIHFNFWVQRAGSGGRRSNSVFPGAAVKKQKGLFILLPATPSRSQKAKFLGCRPGEKIAGWPSDLSVEPFIPPSLIQISKNWLRLRLRTASAAAKAMAGQVAHRPRGKNSHVVYNIKSQSEVLEQKQGWYKARTTNKPGEASQV